MTDVLAVSCDICAIKHYSDNVIVELCTYNVHTIAYVTLHVLSHILIYLTA